MASVAVSGNSSSSDSSQPFEFDPSFRVSAESSRLKAVPSKFNFTNDPTALPSHSLSFPIVDYSALVAADPDLRSKAARDLAAACQERGFFILVNHGISEELMDAMFAAVTEFFGLPDYEKKQYVAKSPLDPIKCGNFNFGGSNSSNQSFTLWKDYLALVVHPDFHCPNQPPHLSEIVREYSERNKKIAHKLIETVCDGLGLEREYVDGVLKLDSGSQVLVANYYPPCPQPDQAIGIPPHTDPALFTFLIHNGLPGLQIEDEGQWFEAECPKNSIFVNVSDQLEIFTNGRYKSVKHRAVVNKDRTRISVVTANGPSREAIMGPAAALVEKDGGAAYGSMKYVDYVTSKVYGGKPLLEQLRIK